MRCEIKYSGFTFVNSPKKNPKTDAKKDWDRIEIRGDLLGNSMPCNFALSVRDVDEAREIGRPIKEAGTQYITVVVNKPEFKNGTLGGFADAVFPIPQEVGDLLAVEAVEQRDGMMVKRGYASKRTTVEIL